MRRARLLQSDAVPPPQRAIGRPMTAPKRRIPSTNYKDIDGSLRRAARPEGTAAFRSGATAPASVWQLRARDPRKNLDLQIQKGAGDDWVIEARGFRWYFSGDLPVRDVMAWVNRTFEPPDR